MTGQLLPLTTTTWCAVTRRVSAHVTVNTRAAEAPPIRMQRTQPLAVNTDSSWEKDLLSLTVSRLEIRAPPLHVCLLCLTVVTCCLLWSPPVCSCCHLLCVVPSLCGGLTSLVFVACCRLFAVPGWTVTMKEPGVKNVQVCFTWFTWFTWTHSV